MCSKGSVLEDPITFMELQQQKEKLGQMPKAFPMGMGGWGMEWGNHHLALPGESGWGY